jgi:quinohemoprotein ethanol dehydrogenase
MVRRLGLGFVAALVAAALFVGPGGFAAEQSSTGDAAASGAKSVTEARLLAAASDADNWLLHGRTYEEQRYSPLDQIHDGNVSEMKLVWDYPLRSNRGVEATPIVVDGVMYLTAPWSIVFALDAKTGAEIWKYDPQVPKEKGRDACCDVVNRGVAVYEGKVYVAALDGRLIALDAETGEVVWQTQTTDPKKPYTITGAPRVVAGKIVIGNGGSEYGVRGYVSAYDAKRGELVWRTYTVPGDPAEPAESEEIEKARETWKGADEWLKRGAGGTAWDAITYDPELGLVYFGTGNGVSWDRDNRSPGGGDNLYLTSVLAVFADTGRVKWSYQLVPGDTWDFDACQQLMLAELSIGGKKRKVVMQAPKVGFFYVWDRESGELLSAHQFADKVTWAKKIDLETGRPIEGEGQRYEKGVVTVYPSPFGAHNWHPMSFSPKTGLVYIPAQESPGAFEKVENFEARDGAWNLGIELSNFKGLDRTLVSGHLLAWDPVKGKEAWRAPYRHINNGGTLATGGNLVFQGTADGRFLAYSADRGKLLFEAPAGTGIIAAPVTYRVDGVQYVTIAAGWGGAIALVGGDAAAAAGVKSIGRVLTFSVEADPIEPPALDADVARGERLFHEHCAVCHGASAVGGGVLPDLRHSNPDVAKVFPLIVKNGIPGTGMAGFGHVVSDEEIASLQSYVRKRADDEHLGR